MVLVITSIKGFKKGQKDYDMAGEGKLDVEIIYCVP